MKSVRVSFVGEPPVPFSTKLYSATAAPRIRIQIRIVLTVEFNSLTPDTLLRLHPMLNRLRPNLTLALQRLKSYDFFGICAGRELAGNRKGSHPNDCGIRRKKRPFPSLTPGNPCSLKKLLYFSGRPTRGFVIITGLPASNRNTRTELAAIDKDSS